MRAWDYLRIEDLLEDFGSDEQRFLRGMDLMARGEEVRGFELLMELLAGDRMGEFLASGTLQTLAAAANTPARAGELLKLYERISSDVPGVSREISELSAFLLRRIGHHREAFAHFRV